MLSAVGAASRSTYACRVASYRIVIVTVDSYVLEPSSPPTCHWHDTTFLGIGSNGGSSTYRNTGEDSDPDFARQ